MKKKHYEYIIIYLSVVIACLFVAVIFRISVIEMGFDKFTANAIFWIVAGLGVIIYSLLSLWLEHLESF